MLSHILHSFYHPLAAINSCFQFGINSTSAFLFQLLFITSYPITITFLRVYYNEKEKERMAFTLKITAFLSLLLTGKSMHSNHTITHTGILILVKNPSPFEEINFTVPPISSTRSLIPQIPLFSFNSSHPLPSSPIIRTIVSC